MLADQARNALVAACLYWLLAGGIAWMWLYARGKLDRVYVSAPIGGDALDFCANVLITAVLIGGWPVTIACIRIGDARRADLQRAGPIVITEAELRRARENLLGSEGLGLSHDAGDRT